MDRAAYFETLSRLMIQKQFLNKEIARCLDMMKSDGHEDAFLIKQVIEEELETEAHRSIRNAKEKKKDAIFAEFFAEVAPLVGTAPAHQPGVSEP